MNTLLLWCSILAAWGWQSRNTGAPLRAVHFSDGLVGTAVGDDGTILRTADGGGTWSARKSGVEWGLRSVHFLNADRGWAVGEQEARRKRMSGMSKDEYG